MEIPEEIPRLPDRLTLRSYQSNAVRKWLQSGGRGVLEMATGAGKTITALSAATQLAEGLRQPLVLVIVVPYLHLVDQWNDEARKFGLSPVVCSGSQSSWVRFAEAVVLRANAGHRRFTSLIATNATFCGDSFQKVLRSIRALTMLVADEVHNLGAPKLAKSLPEHAQLRMGLSATPTRWLDPDGTDRLTRYFGPTAFRFDLRDALRADPPVLVPYRYHPILVDLDQSEQEQYIELTTAIGRLIGSDDDSPLSDMAKALLIKRSRLIACARNKLPRLRQTIAPFASSIHNLIYCGDGSFDFADDGNDRSSEPTVLRQIDAVTMMLGRDLHMSVAQFTSDTPTAERREILQRFGAGELQALVAIRCLDEGVDVPAITRAFILASSSNPRQFVQRRGRILRRASGKSLAEIYDFVVRPPECFMGDQSGFTGARALIRREMSRVAEFAGLADNGPEARSILLPVLRAWDLLHL
jgi:DNA phosphorothioation system restriction enzyme